MCWACSFPFGLRKHHEDDQGDGGRSVSYAAWPAGGYLLHGLAMRSAPVVAVPGSPLVSGVCDPCAAVPVPLDRYLPLLLVGRGSDLCLFSAGGEGRERIRRVEVVNAGRCEGC